METTGSTHLPPTETCDELLPEIAAHALSGEPLSAPARAHLQGCAYCRGMQRSYQGVAATLPYSAPAVAPPPALRERLIAAVEAEAAAAAPANTPEAVPTPLPGAPPRRAVRVRSLWGALAGAFALIVALLGWNISLQQQLAAQTAQIAGSRSGWQTMIVLLDDPTVQVYRLAGDTSFGTVWGTPAGTTGCLMLEDLPAAANGQVFHVWLRDANGWTSGGTFDTRGASKEWYIFEAPQPLQHYRSVMVTLEAGEQVGQPQGQQIVSGDLGAQRT